MSQHERKQLMERTMRRAGELRARRDRRQRIVRTVPPLALAAALTAGVTAAVLTATSGGNRKLPPAGSGSVTTTTSSPGVTTTTAPSGSTTTTTPVATRVPGFAPSSFTSVSLSDWWLLGTAPCPAGTCPTVVRTTDGGSSFSKVAFPTGAVNASSGVQAGIRFADSQHGWAFGPGLAYTANGGASWTDEQMPGRVIDLEAADGHAFALACSTTSSCGTIELLESSVSSGSWSAVSLPVQIGEGQAALSVQGQTVVVTGGPPPANQSSPDNLIVSTDGGAHFAVYPSPCYPGLAGKAFVSLTDPTSWWAACPTGMLAGAFRSTDSGHTWTAVRPAGSVEFSNGLSISPVSSATALAWPGNQSALELTTDRGAHFSSVLKGGNSAVVVWAGFADPSRAYAILETNPSPVPSYELWESSDGGQHWQQVRFSG